MKPPIEIPTTAVELIDMIDQFDLTTIQRRDMISAVKRICTMIGVSPSRLKLKPKELRIQIRRILPAAHGITKKTFANLRSQFAAALELAIVVQRPKPGTARRYSAWQPLVTAIADDKRLACGLAAFANWCAAADIQPEHVTDKVVLRFHDWLVHHTLCPKPNDIVRRIPRCWNEAQGQITGWPDIQLEVLSFRPKSGHLTWDDLDPAFRNDADAHLAMREKPDLFDDRPHAPRRPLATDTVRLHRDHIRLAASVLVANGQDIATLKELRDIVTPEAMKTVLRHYHNKAGGKPSSFAVSIAKTLQQIGRYHLGQSEDELNRLRDIAGRLPSIPYDLTDKNKALLRFFESEQNLAALLHLPERLLSEAKRQLDEPRLPFVKAQVAIAVDILTVASLRPQNLVCLNWRRHFSEPDGSKRRLMLHIPASETKTGKRELIFEVPADVANRLRWYRRNILPRSGADPDGPLFVTGQGSPKHQETLSQQITEGLAEHIGLHMTPHQFRHLVAWLYLEEHPEDFETVRALLGHSFSKTTLIYAGASSQRASRAHGNFIIAQREKLKHMRRPSRRRKA